jgi:hypothetical protein
MKFALVSGIKRRKSMSEKWKINGTYFEASNCEAACPCIFLVFSLRRVISIDPATALGGAA